MGSGDETTRPPSRPEGEALDLVERTRPGRVSVDLATEATDRLALGDYGGALRVAELLLGMRPEHAEALQVARECREKLEQMAVSRLGSLRAVPEVAVHGAELRWLGLDHRSGFLLSRVDGRNTIEEIIDVSGMTRLETLRTLVELLEAGAIRVGR
ncbi:MAG: hypothetical protein KC543_16960 [Myxococcales bacterium]|nr:hypothetical protein [Myxococcales bacterium]